MYQKECAETFHHNIYMKKNKNEGTMRNDGLIVRIELLLPEKNYGISRPGLEERLNKGASQLSCNFWKIICIRPYQF